MIQLYLSILLSLVLSTSCANTNMSKQGVKSEESVSFELQLSDVDFSAEVDGRFYTYFRFVNQTSVPILYRTCKRRMMKHLVSLLPNIMMLSM